MPIKIQGREHITYDELLDKATHAGLHQMETQVVQFPAPENDYTTIVHARAIFQDSRAFDGIGDANPRNVSKNIAAHAIRMAETRSKARALRDALNIKGAAAEELDASPDLDQAAAGDARRRLTDKQIALVKAKSREANLSPDACKVICADHNLPDTLTALWSKSEFDSLLNLIDAHATKEAA